MSFEPLPKFQNLTTKMAYIKSLLILIALLIYSFFYEKLLLYFVNNGVFSKISSEYFNLADTIFYLPIIFCAIFFFKDIRINEKVNIGYFVMICLIAFLFKVIENPIVNINSILEHKRIIIPDNTDDKYDVFPFILSFFNVVLLTSLSEEFLFRKLILSFFNKKNIFIGCIFSSILFSAYHFSFENITSTKPLIIFFLGLILSLIFVKYGLFYSILLHSCYNFLWLLIDINKMGYAKLLNNSNFSYSYWCIIGLSLIIFFYLLKRLNISFKSVDS